MLRSRLLEAPTGFLGPLATDRCPTATWDSAQTSPRRGRVRLSQKLTLSTLWHSLSLGPIGVFFRQRRGWPWGGQVEDLSTPLRPGEETSSPGR